MKKKLFSRISAIFMALILLVSMFSVLALAEESTTRLIDSLPDSTQDVSLTIHKYDGTIKTTDGNLVHSTGNELKADEIPAGLTKLDGVQFTVQKATPATESTTGTKVTVKDINGEPKLYVLGDTVGQKKTADGVVEFKDLDQGIYYVTETNSAETGRSPVQPFVVELPMTNPDYVNGSTSESGSAWIYDVHVYPKNQELPLEKSVEEINNHSTTSYIGQIQKWIITSVIPRDIVAELEADGKTDIVNPEAKRADQVYTITDYMDSRLTFVEETEADAAPAEYANKELTVTIFSKYGSVNQVPTSAVDSDKAFVVLDRGTDPVTDPKDYTISTSKVTSGEFEGRTQIVITMQKAGFNKIAKALGDIDGVDGKPALFIGVELYSYINDTILKDAANKDTTNDQITADEKEFLGVDIPNNAGLNFKNQYTPESDEGVTIVTPPSIVHTGGVALEKKDADNKDTKLEGAVFAIASSEDNAKAGHFLQIVDKNGVKTIVDYVDPANKEGKIPDEDYINDGWEDGISTDSALYKQLYTATSNRDGIAKFYGLEYGATVINCAGADGGCSDSNGDGIIDTHVDSCPFVQGATATKQPTEKDPPAQTGDPSRTYWIVELVSPKIMEEVQNEDGTYSKVFTGKYYNLLEAPKDVTVNATSHLVANATEVVNSKGFKLPTTGGIGTTILTVAGSALMVSAAIFFFVLKKKSKKSDTTAA